MVRLLRGLDTHRWQHTVVLLGRGGRLKPTLVNLGVRIQSLGATGVWSAAFAMRRLSSILRRERPDLLQGWMYHGNMAALLGAWLARWDVPVLWNIRHALHDLGRGRTTTTMLIRLGAPLSHRAQRVIYNSETGARQHEAIGYSVRRTEVIPNGFDTADFQPSEHCRQVFRQQLGVAEEVVLIGMFGRYHPLKDHSRFLRAASRLLSQQTQPVAFVLGGRGVEPTNQPLRLLVRTLGIEDRVYLLGEVTDMPHVLPAMDIVCSCSRSESFPNVIGEAMACGVPCVVTDVGDAARLVGETGILVPAGSAAALAAALGRLVSRGAGARRELGATARRRVQDLFSLGRMVSRFDELYRAALVDCHK